MPVFRGIASRFKTRRADSSRDVNRGVSNEIARAGIQEASLKESFKTNFRREPSDMELRLQERALTRGLRVRWFKGQDGGSVLRTYQKVGTSDGGVEIRVSEFVFDEKGANAEHHGYSFSLDAAENDLRTNIDRQDQLIAENGGASVTEVIADSNKWPLVKNVVDRPSRDRKTIKKWLLRAGGGAAGVGVGSYGLYEWLANPGVDLEDYENFSDTYSGPFSVSSAGSKDFSDGSRSDAVIFGGSTDQLPQVRRASSELQWEAKRGIDTIQRNEDQRDYNETVVFEAIQAYADFVSNLKNPMLRADVFNYLLVICVAALQGFRADTLYVSDIVKKISTRAMLRGAAPELPLTELSAYVNAIYDDVDLV